MGTQGSIPDRSRDIIFLLAFRTHCLPFSGYCKLFSEKGKVAVGWS
jgi:hypothetical protein